MKFESLSSFFKHSTHCVICKNVMPLYCLQRNNNEVVPFRIENDKCELTLLRKIAGGIHLFLDENKYVPGNNSQSGELLSKAANFKQIVFSRKCHMCLYNYEMTTVPLYFTDKVNFAPVKLAYTKFSVPDINSNKDFVKVTNNLENKQTYLVRVYFEGKAFLAKHTAPVIVPLVNFNFDDHQKMVNKIKTLLTLS